jgi:hypothetical protein
MPTDYHGGTPLPVLMDPYGGPHGRRCFRWPGITHVTPWKHIAGKLLQVDFLRRALRPG